MAIFNKREVGYIKAIAGVGNHKTFKHSRISGDLSNHLSLDASNSRLDGVKKCKGLCVFLNRAPHVVDSTDTSIDFKSWVPQEEKSKAGFHSTTYAEELNCLSVEPIQEGSDTTTVTTDQRVGDDFYLNATHIKMRFTMPDFGAVPSGGNVQPHHEYRLIIFRNRLPTLSRTGDDNAMDGNSFINFHYDLFNGYVGRRIGLQGWRQHEAFDGGQHYVGFKRGADTTQTVYVPNSEPIGPTSEPNNISVDDVMTLPLNDTDYVIHTDERFFLGREHGKSHYEKVVRFDWRERGTTNQWDLTEGLRDGFNPNWIVLLFATTNDDVDPNINYLMTATTSLESA